MGPIPKSEIHHHSFPEKSGFGFFGINPEGLRFKEREPCHESVRSCNSYKPLFHALMKYFAFPWRGNCTGYFIYPKFLPLKKILANLRKAMPNVRTGCQVEDLP
jgi:hypothetical protein